MNSNGQPLIHYPSAGGNGPEEPPRFTPRSHILSLVKAALAVDEPRFARRTALAWLAAYPGDLEMSLLHAKALAMLPAPPHTRMVTPLNQAISILEGLVREDPEFLEAQETLYQVRRKAGLATAEDNLGSLLALGAQVDNHSSLPAWSYLVKKARQSLAEGKVDTAEYLIHQALLANSSAPLISATHLLIEQKRKLPAASIGNLAELYHERWPECLLFSLTLADSLMDTGEADRAVSLLHEAAAKDVTGTVAKRIWGEDHPYRVMWPETLRIVWPADLSIPAPVAAVFGWNRLPPARKNYISGECPPLSTDALETVGIPLPEELPWAELTNGAVLQHKSLPEEPAEPEGTEECLPGFRYEDRREGPRNKSLPEDLLNVQTELEKIANRIKQPLLARADGRYPVYTVMSTRYGLEKQYGKEGAAKIYAALKELTSAAASRKGWDALIFYADEGYGECPNDESGEGVMGMLFEKGRPLNLGIKSARPNDAWSLKLSLADLDEALAKRGQMIAALLIVGGPEIVPFHRLPNPVEDSDAEVPSDNPYGTRDENYFIPEWPVGRLAAGIGESPEVLIELIRGMAADHRRAARRKVSQRNWWHEVVQGLTPGFMKKRRGQGYTAAIWKQASLAVFRPVGEKRGMLVSPPVQANVPLDEVEFSGDGNGRAHHPLKNLANNKRLALRPARMGYFNLHGLPDAVEWFGQADPEKPWPGSDYPVALRPQDIGNGKTKGKRTAPMVIFSEACFGAHITGRTLDESIPLKFLAAGTRAFAGSTCTAYGSISAPLAAADLLAFSFWSNIKDGLPAGEALRRAKIELAREMHRRQGYLDGEDQKTLISFVLYGDPLAQPVGSSKEPKPVFRSLKPPAQVKTVCERCDEAAEEFPETVTYVKHIVSQYLPGMMDAQMTIAREHGECQGEDHTCPTCQMGPKSRPAKPPDRKVVLLNKQVKSKQATHNHYARLTIDAQGKLVKLVVSR